MDLQSGSIKEENSIDSTLTEEQVEAFLDANPEFVESYFNRKAQRTLLGSFLRHSRGSTRSRSRAATPPVANEFYRSPSSGTSTPVRKSSYSDFDNRGILKPIVNVNDGPHSFLGLERQLSRPSRQRKSKEELQQLRVLDEHAFLMELVKDIANDLEVKTLCYKILQNVSLLTSGDRCSIFIVKGSRDGSRFLSSQIFDVNADSKLEDLNNIEEITVPWGTGIVGYTAETGEVVNIPDAYQDSRFNQDIDKRTGYKTKSILCMPVMSGDGHVIGVAQVINKVGRDGLVHVFNADDEKIFERYLVFCGIGITNAHLFERSQAEIARNQVLLDLTRAIFEEQSSLDNIVHKIMMSTQSFLQCERCSVLLVDPTSKGLFSQAFDLEARECFDDDGQTIVRKQSCGTSEVRFPINIGITGFVATTGETLNIPDAYADPRFDPSVDEGSGFRTKTILCMPIRNAAGDLIGVVQLLNKMDGSPFNENDENFFEAFAIFCGMAIHHTAMYEECQKALARQKVALEILSYHASESDEEAEKLLEATVPSVQQLQLTTYSFDDISLSDKETCLATLRVFLDLQFVQKFHIDYQTLCKWVLSVKKNYRNVIYHNWRHAFNVMQMMYAMLKHSSELSDAFTDNEKLALIVGCLCHDLDHRGTNNTFQVKSESALAQLYGTSVMEHHHFDHCIMILNSPGNEIFQTLSTEEYNEVIQLLEQAILATDLALYFKKRGLFFNIVKSNNFDWMLDHHRSLLRSMLMTASDISAITKPWKVQHRVAQLVAEEFFQQGDREARELNMTPMEMMDRQKKDKLPKMQCDFIINICSPIYENLAVRFSELKTLNEGCSRNKSEWEGLAKEYEESTLKNGQ